MDERVYRPKWFPDGSAISFIVDRSSNSIASRLEAVDRDGSNRRLLVSRRELPNGWDGIATYAWSPSGARLVLCLLSDRFHPRTYVASADGSKLRLVRRKSCGEDWSSTGRLLAAQGRTLLEMDPDGSNVVKLVPGLKVNDADWSPNGRKIAFECGRSAHRDICVIRANGDRLRNLTNSERIDWSPSWSPDGSRIVWAPSTKTARQRADLWRMRADGTSKFRLTNSPIDEYEPDWTP